VPLAVFPMGTENLVAKYLGVPRDGQAIARTIVDAHSLVLDAARANGRSFLLMLSAGVDAEVVRRMHAIRKGNIHKLQYAWPVVSSLIGTATHRILATSADGQYEAEGSHVIVTNIPAYGFGFQFSPDAQPDDGLLDVRVFRPDSRISVMSHVVTMRVLPQLAERDVIRFRCSELLLSTPESGATIPAQADGDPFPALPLNIAVQPKRLHLLVPRKSPFAAGQGRAQLSNL
jgi:diacylglycerol kinase (ATP)